MDHQYEIVERKLLSVHGVVSTVDPSVYRKAAIVSSRLPSLVRLTDVMNIGDELLNETLFMSLAHARVEIAAWVED